MPLPVRLLPRADLPLTELGLGCGPIAGMFRAVSEADARATIRAAWDAGMRLFDTAPYYGGSASEHHLGAELHLPGRAEAVVCTKVGKLMRPERAGVAASAPGMWIDPLPFRLEYDYSGAAVVRSFEDSQQRLGRARIDILLVHDIGPLTHGSQDGHHWRELTDGGGFEALRGLRDGGDIRAIGLGVNEAEVMLRAMDHAALDCVLLAGRYTLLEQGGRALLDRCRREGVGVIVGGPFNSGILASGAAAPATYDYRPAPPEVLARVAALEAVCRDHAVPLPAAALQMPMAHPAVVSCVPGPYDPGQLADIVRWHAHPIPGEFWQALRTRRLVSDTVPLPGDTGAASI